MNQSEFVRGYLEGALWSSLDGEGEPRDKRFSLSSLDPADKVRMETTAKAFYTEHEDDLAAFDFWPPAGTNPFYYAGMDLWLTQNGHGAGFWDGDWPEAEGERLSEAAKALGEFDLYEGDDGILYLFPPDMTEKEVPS